MSPAIPHFRNARGVNTIRTPELDLLVEDVQTITDPSHLSMGAAFGDWGCGKTFATKWAFEKVTIRRAYIALPAMTTPRGLLAAIGEELEGAPWDAPHLEMRRDALRLLSEPTFIALDDAHKLQPSAITELRWLYDHDRTQVAVLLIGGDRLAHKLEIHGEVDDRVVREVAFEPLRDSEAVTAMRAFHPLYRDVPAETIARLNPLLKGRFRRWTSFTLDTIERGVGERGVALTMELAVEIIGRQRRERRRMTREDREHAR